MSIFISDGLTLDCILQILQQWDCYKRKDKYTTKSKLTLISRILFVSIRIPGVWASFLSQVFFKSRHV